MHRRRLLSGVVATTFMTSVPAFAAPPLRRIVSLDWGISETLYAMKVPVIGAADNIGYDRVIETPATPPSTLNLGLWSAPNIELLQALKPDLVLIQAWQQGLLPLLRPISPIEVVTIYTRRGSIYDRACGASRAMAQRLGRVDVGEAMISGGETVLERCRTALRALNGKSVLVVMIVDGRGFIAFSRASMFHDIIERLDLVNGWTGAPQLLCGASMIDLATLASSQADHVVVVDPPGRSTDQAFYQSRLWTSLPFVVAQRVTHIASLWEFGALPTGYRFAELVTAALTSTKTS